MYCHGHNMHVVSYVTIALCTYISRLVICAEGCLVSVMIQVTFGYLWGSLIGEGVLIK